MKKPPPPSSTQSPPAKPEPAPSNNDQISVETITAVLDSNLHPSAGVTLPQMTVMLEMIVMLAFERRVERPFFMTLLERVLRAVSLIECLKAEVRMMTALELPDEQVHVLDQATRLSMN